MTRVSTVFLKNEIIRAANSLNSPNNSRKQRLIDEIMTGNFNGLKALYSQNTNFLNVNPKFTPAQVKETINLYIVRINEQLKIEIQIELIK